MAFRVTCVAIFLLSVLPVAFGSGEAAYREAPDEHRSWYVAEYRKALEQVESAIKRTRVRKQREELELIRDALLENDPVFLPSLVSADGLPQFKTGRIGKLNSEADGIDKLTVFQVVEDGVLLVEPTYSVAGVKRDFVTGRLRRAGSYEKGDLFFLSGVDTTDITDGDRLSIDAAFIVAGTKTYTTALGGSNTVFQLESLPPGRSPFAARDRSR